MGQRDECFRKLSRNSVHEVIGLLRYHASTPPADPFVHFAPGLLFADEKDFFISNRLIGAGAVGDFTLAHHVKPMGVGIQLGAHSFADRILFFHPKNPE